MNYLKDAVTYIKTKKEKPPTHSVIRYNSKGESDEKNKIKFKDEVSAALKLTVGKDVSYKIKSEAGGNLYNPKNDTAVYNLDAEERTKTRKLFEYRVVNKAAFDNYIKFLQTKSDAYLTMAERAG